AANCLGEASAHTLVGRAIPSLGVAREPATTVAITRLVQLSSRHAWPVILSFLLLAIFSGIYSLRHFVITTDSNKLLSSSLPWRQQEMMLDAAFPQRIDRIVAVIDATTPEAADNAADALVNTLAARRDVIRTAVRPDSGEFFERNGILFLSLDEVERATSDLISAQPFLGTLAADPSLRGVFQTFSQSLEGVRLGRTKLEDLKPAFTALADALPRLAPGERRGPWLVLAHADQREGAEKLRSSAVRAHSAGA